MRYACLIYGDPADDPAENTPEWTALMEEHNAFGAKWGSKLTGGEALHPIDTATTVRRRDGELLTTDGPFAETKEHLGGFYIIEAEDLDEAIQIAADTPGVSKGSIEVRPVMVFD